MPLHPNKILTVAFLKPGPGDPAFNHVVANMCKHKVCHTEIVFEDNMAFSIFAGMNIFFKPRSFSNPDYHLISLSVSQAEYNKAYSFCQQAVEHNLCFTDFGMLSAYFQPQSCPIVNTAPSIELGYTFCSKIVTEALQYANIIEVDHLIPCTTTPSTLYEALKDSPRKVLNSVPYKRDQLRNSGIIIKYPRFFDT